MPPFMRPFYIAALLSFLIHLPLVFLFEGEFTDGVLQTHYFSSPAYVVSEPGVVARYVPPFYPALIWIISAAGMDPLVAGRLISLAAYCLVGLCLVSAAKSIRCPSEEGSQRLLCWTVWLAWTLSPMANRWALHAMTDMTFCFLSTASVVCFVRLSERGGEQSEASPDSLFLLGNLFGMLALWTRYQGLGILALAAACLLLLRKERRPQLWLVALAALLWTVSLLLIRKGFGVHGEQFADRSVYPSELYLSFALSALRYLPYAITPPLAFLAIYGIYKVIRRGKRSRIWIGFGLLAGLTGLAVHAFFLSFQFRYGLPLLPFLCLLGGIGAACLPQRFRNPALVILFVWQAAFTGAVLAFQHETFGDIHRASRKAAELAPESAALWAAEQYNPKFKNIKTSAWAGRSVQWLDESSLGKVREGDLILDPNVYPLDPALLARLREKWKLKTVAEETSRTIPLLPGEILSVEILQNGQPLRILSTSQPELMAFRYKQQHYATSVYQVQRK